MKPCCPQFCCLSGCLSENINQKSGREIFALFFPLFLDALFLFLSILLIIFHFFLLPTDVPSFESVRTS